MIQPNDVKKGKIGRHWIPPMNAVMRHPAYIKKSSRWSDIALHSARQLPDVATMNSFRWDRPADYYKRFGGKPPSFLYCGEVYDQGSCGACWAFSVALVHTSRLRIWTQQNVPLLSPTTILSCVKTQTSKGCLGGSPSEAAEYCLSSGLPSLDCADYEWCTARTNYCTSGGGSASAPGSCECENADIPACADVGSCVTCSCPTQGADSCASPTCKTNANGGGGSSDAERYSFITVDDVPDAAAAAPATAQNPHVSLMTTDGGASPGDVADLQLRIMLEIFQHGPVQASYYVMSDFYDSTVSGGSSAAAKRMSPLWQATGGIYMNAPDLPDLYSSSSSGGNSPSGFSSTIMCENADGSSPATCIIGGHAVSIIGFGSVAASRVPMAGSGYSSIRGPLELLSSIEKPDANVLCYWVCQNSWGKEWNADQTGVSNSDGLSGGKWWHAMSGTYEFISSETGDTKRVAVNNAIALDHPVSSPPGGGSSGGSGRSNNGGLFGGVTTWPVATHMARFPFPRGTFFKKVDKYAHTLDLVACQQLMPLPGGGGDFEDVGCALVPAKFCTTKILTQDGKPMTTCKMGADSGDGGGDDDDDGGGSGGYTPEATPLPLHDKWFYITVGILVFALFGGIVFIIYSVFKTKQTPNVPNIYPVAFREHQATMQHGHSEEHKDALYHRPLHPHKDAADTHGEMTFIINSEVGTFNDSAGKRSGAETANTDEILDIIKEAVAKNE